MSWYKVIERIIGKKDNSGDSSQESESTAGIKIDFLDQLSVGQKFTEPPLIAHVLSVDLDKDGLMDALVCDAKNNFVSWIRQSPANTFTETILAGDLIAPAHVQAFDFDIDGDLDIMVGILGMLFPNNDKIGSVVILENDGKQNFKSHLVAEKIARVSDVRAGDLDNDGDIDLAVAQFGYDDGETRWIENLGNWKFKSHILQNLSGPINVEIIDIDHDNDNDIISLVSQEWEEIYCFVNDGKGNFQPKLIWGSSNQDYGSSSIFISDINQDGKEDILYTNGDAFDYIPPQGRPWHGVQWFENKGNINFEYHRICNFTGATNVKPADIDHDNDIDLFAVSAFNLWDNPESQSIIWLENDGSMKFIRHDIAKTPTHILSLDIADYNNDGELDIITGNMHTYPPFDRMARVLLWKNNAKLRK
ncbi:MAG: VCBS repeat-containing protein [Bacteroidetes bacterium]|nr:VCBS repeat-containing protein [Bacteroidota bacterium]